MLKEELQKENLGLIVKILGEQNIDKIERDFELTQGNESLKKCSYVRKTILDEVNTKTMDKLSIYEDGDILLYFKNSEDKSQYLELCYSEDKICCINAHIKDNKGGNYYIKGSSFNSEIKCLYYDLESHRTLCEVLEKENVEITSSSNEFEYYGIQPRNVAILEYFSSIEESIDFARNLVLDGSEYIETLYDSSKRKKLTF